MPTCNQFKLTPWGLKEQDLGRLEANRVCEIVYIRLKPRVLCNSYTVFNLIKPLGRLG